MFDRLAQTVSSTLVGSSSESFVGLVKSELMTLLLEAKGGLRPGYLKNTGEEDIKKVTRDTKCKFERALESSAFAQVFHGQQLLPAAAVAKEKAKLANALSDVQAEALQQWEDGTWFDRKMESAGRWALGGGIAAGVSAAALALTGPPGWATMTALLSGTAVGASEVGAVGAAGAVAAGLGSVGKGAWDAGCAGIAKLFRR